MDYSTYWSILDTPSKSIQSNLVFLCISFGAGLLWFLTKKYKKDKGDGDKTGILWATGAFAILGLVGYVVLTFIYKDKIYDMTKEMLNSPKTPRVEGVISNFERTYRNGKETIEKFTVNGIQFAYGDALLGQFNSFSHTYNDVIYDGQKVRITYSADSYFGDDYNSILKLEIAK